MTSVRRVKGVSSVALRVWALRLVVNMNPHFGEFCSKTVEKEHNQAAKASWCGWLDEDRT
jgi:hypothetical protein